MSSLATTHGYITNKSFSWLSEFRQSLPGFLNYTLGTLGSEVEGLAPTEYLVVYRLLPDATQDEEPRTPEYIQAGGHADRMTVEIREKTDNGYTLSTIGRPEAAGQTSRSEAIHIGTNTTHVLPAEVLTADDAIELFEHYYDHHTIPTGWHKRPWMWWNHNEEPLKHPPTGPDTISAAGGHETASPATAQTQSPQPSSRKKAHSDKSTTGTDDDSTTLNL